MGIVTPGVGGNVSGPATPQAMEIVATAWTEINKASLGIVFDTLSVPFTELNAYTVWHYVSTASQPVLSHHEGQVRSASNLRLEQKSSEVEDALKEKEREIDPEIKDSSLYFILKQLLKNALGIFIWMENINQSVKEEPMFVEKTEEHRKLAYRLLCNLALLLKDHFPPLENTINSLGPNDPLWDPFSQVLNQLKKVQASMEELVAAHAANPEGLNFDPKMGELAESLYLLDFDYNRTRSSDELLTLSALTKAAHFFSDAMAASGPRSSYFTIASALSLIEGSKQAGKGLLWGESFNAVSSLVADAALLGLPDTVALGGKNFLKKIIQELFWTAAGCGFLLNTKHYSYVNVKDPNQRLFAFDLALHFISSCQAFETIFKTLLEYCGVPHEMDKSSMVKILAAFSLFLMLQSATLNAPAERVNLIGSLSNYFLSAIQVALDHYRRWIAGVPDLSEQFHNAAVALQQAKIALESQNYNEVKDAFDFALDSLGQSPSLYEKNLQQAGLFALHVANAYGANPELTNTTIIQVI